MDPTLLTTITDISFLPLDHPGAKDMAYRARRNEIAKVARDFLGDFNGASTREVPQVEYTDEENETWRIATTYLAPLHHDLASSLYLTARDKLPISTRAIPQLAELNRRLKGFHGFGIGPVEGLIDARIFLGMLEEKFMLCTQYIRHASRPEYTPEPDIVHEVIGHVPMFTNKDFVDFSQMVGAAARKATDEELRAIERLYWYTIEFGLIQEGADVKAYGAGLLSSFGEIQHCFTEEVERVPFSFEEVAQTPYDYSHMQSKLFIVPSFRELRRASEKFLNSILCRS